eukprot:m.91567 g.91567  ORF g.91567 m.91567 type:complete len:88 (+) comp12951_c0_seq5:283-546(+)
MDTIEKFVEIISEVVPEAKDLITVGGPVIPIMADVSEEGLTALLKTVPAPHELVEPFPLPLADGIRRTAEEFRKLAAEGRLHDKDLE